MQTLKKIPHDLLVAIISSYANPGVEEIPCVEHVVENTLEVLSGLGLLLEDRIDQTLPEVPLFTNRA